MQHGGLSYPTAIVNTTAGDEVYQEGHYGQYYGMQLTHTFQTNTHGHISPGIEITERVTITGNQLGGGTGVSHDLGKEIWKGARIVGSEIDDMIGTPIDTWKVLKTNLPPLVANETQQFCYRYGPSGGWAAICTIAIQVTLNANYQVITTVNGVSVTQKCKYRQVRIPGIGLARNFGDTEYIIERNP